ncbi:MAG: ribonuclease BN, partial [Candidatus Nanohaloarchaea archaeon]|nr:ribonuclease BN [Candidatus Nanohaloarchaea archaeon]
MSDLYSLWLVPEEDSTVYDRLSSLIQKYAKRYEDAPVFEPHVTAVGGLEFGYDTVKEAAGTLADRNPPVEITLTRPHISTTRHQCVFLLAEPATELLEFHREGAKLLGIDPGMYIP